jgi:mono/diheme cytochrome c family protein
MGPRGIVAGGLLLVVLSGALAADEEAPAKLYAMRCKPCHGDAGQSPNEDRNLADDHWIHGSSLADVVKVIEDGVPGKAMMPFKEQLGREEIEAVARYVLSFSKKAKAGKRPSS